MGQDIPRWHFTEADRDAFVKQLGVETRRLSGWEKAGRFSAGPTTAGYELEACLVNQDFRPVDANDDFLRRLAMPEVVPELARSNIEFNGRPYQLEGDGLARMHAELDQWLTKSRELAQSLGLRMLMIGILPTLTEADINLSHISDSNRYHAINRALVDLRGREKVYLQIRSRANFGDAQAGEYRGEFDSIMAESAATSFQLHLRLPGHAAADWYNAALMVSAPVLAVAANSPFLFGHDLWAETRIPVFAQSVDTGHYHYVSFGQGYVNHTMSELFDRNLHHYPALLPALQGGAGLPNLKLHNGTIWRWNRPIIDGDQNECAQDIHYRVEHRCLPSGPSTLDMMANAAFFWGLMSSFSQQPPGLRFKQARQNFYRAARDGIASKLRWVDGHEYQVDKLVAGQLLPIARGGLERLHVDSSSIQLYLDVIRQRVERGLSGAGWQRAWLQRHGGDISSMLAAYEKLQWSGQPVGEWPV